MEENKKVEETGSISRFDSFFEITKRGSSVGVEIIAGIVTFLAMAYILTLNPNIIAGGSSLWGSVFIATALGAVVGTLLMALVAKMPLAQASGLGLNSMVASAMAGFLIAGKNFSFASTMLLVFISGFIFLLLSFIPYKRDAETDRLVAIREAIFKGMPKQLRAAISVGIGLFITIIGLANCKIIGSSDGVTFFTLVDLLPFNNADFWNQGQAACSAVVALFGLFLITILAHFKVKGAVIIGILASTILLAWPLGVTDIGIIKGESGVTWKFWESIGDFFSCDTSKNGTFFVIFTEGFDGFPAGSLFGCVIVVITFCMIDMFDTMGTAVGCCATANLMDENGTPKNYNKIMLCDSIATCAGSLFGTSTVTTFVESGSGIAAGGRTGFASLVTAALFLVAIFLMPVFAFIPSEACSAALIYVGALMMGNVKDVDFKEIRTAVPAFLTIVFMPFGYSITDGIGMGVISYVIINFIVWVIEIIAYKSGRREEKPVMGISIVLFIVFALFLVYFLVPTSF